METSTQVGISRKSLIALLLSQGYREVAEGKYDKTMKDAGNDIIMRFAIERGEYLEHSANVKVLYRVVGGDNFEVIGVGNIRQMRIAPHGKLLGVGSVPKKKAFDRKKFRTAIAEGRTYQRGD